MDSPEISNSENRMPENLDGSGSEGHQNLDYPMESQQQGASEYIMESNAEYEEGMDQEEGEEDYGEEGGHGGEELYEGQVMVDENGNMYIAGEEGEEEEGDEEEGDHEEMEMPSEYYQQDTSQNYKEMPSNVQNSEEKPFQTESRLSKSNIDAVGENFGRRVSQDNESSKSDKKKISYDEDGDIETLFEQDFDLIKKIRKMLLYNINKERIERGLPYFSIDIITNLLATEYAMYLKNNEHDPNFFQLLCEQYNNIGEINLIWINSKFEEDARINEDLLLETFEEIGLILLESTEEKHILLDPNSNHIGLGIAATDEGIIVVQIVSQKIITIKRIQEIEEGNIEIRGRMLDDRFGIMATRVMNLDTNKDILVVGPEKIDFDRKTKDFIISLPFENPLKGPRKLIEYYVRINPDSIPYKKQTRDKLKLKEYKVELRTPCLVFPDLKFMDKDEVDKPYFSLSAEKSLKKDAFSPKRKIDTPTSDKKEDEIFESERKMEEKKESIEIAPKIVATPNIEAEEKAKKIAFEQAKEQAISNKEIKEELEISLAEAQKQYDELMQQKMLLEEKIKLLKNKTDVFVDRQGDVAMNEHKYLNTLAHVHQIRLDLKQTQEKYNKMAADLQKKLEEKQKKCNEIKMTFMELKREVARKAAYSRTDKPIPEKMIDEWEERELEKNKILQELRLDILRLRNNLAKNKKILKKKEELAEGLHLIDFEQLKIENQTLNEKIEERNEDLHKLKKKNTTTVQILTHTREKLGFVQKKNDELEKISKEKELELNKKGQYLTKLKRKKDSLRKKNLELKQQSGIINSDELRKDFQFRKNNIEKLKTRRDELKTQKEEMEKVIKEYYKSQGKTYSISNK